MFYQSVDGRRVFAVPVSSGTKFTAGAPTTIFEGSFVPVSPSVRGFDVTPDGQFVMIEPANADAGAVANVVVVQNWIEELKRLVPTVSQSK